ncbi:MAG: TIGR03084 family metal-binding protein [Pseudomonadota bacterium]
MTSPSELNARVVADLVTEGAELYKLLKEMDTGYWTQASAFKSWTVWDVVAHLHVTDHLALTSLRGDDEFRALNKELANASLAAYTNRWLEDNNGHAVTGPELLERWHSLFKEMCDALADADPARRYLWFGPGMKARMFATARQMETWAHGWEVYDLMGQTRQHTDRLQNIATIGVRTFAWTFNNRKLPVPEILPFVDLTAPSGASWQWHEPSGQDFIRGSAVEFCQVVTQVRNIADTDLQVSGDSANAWMSIAQCFAGPPEEPPAPGSRATR